jgi:hypothetical protein
MKPSSIGDGKKISDNSDTELPNAAQSCKLAALHFAPQCAVWRIFVAELRNSVKLRKWV